eukprot:gene3454-2405_t
MHSKTTIPTNKPNTASHESTQFQGLIPMENRQHTQNNPYRKVEQHLPSSPKPKTHN